MADGSDCGSRGTVSAVQRNNSGEDDTQLRKHAPGCTMDVVDGRCRSPSSPAKPEVETKTTSGLEVADIVCLSPSKVEKQTTEGCNVIPIEMASGLSENGRRNRIRIVLGGKLFPVPASQLCTSDSLRSICLYSDDEVDCNDDGRSLDRPLPRRIPSDRVNEVHQYISKQPPEQHRTGKVEVPQSKTDGVSKVEDSNVKEEVNHEKAKTAVSSPDVRKQNSTNIDDRSRSPRRQRLSDDRRAAHASSREEWDRHRSSQQKSRSPDVNHAYRRSSGKGWTSGGGRSSRSEQSDGNIVAVDRGNASHRRSTTERYTDISPRQEPTRSGHRNEVSGSRDRRDSRSRSRSRHNRDETGSSSRSRTKEHRQARAESDERQRRWSKHDTTSVSGRRSDRQTSSRAKPDVESRCWRQDRRKEPDDIVTPTVPCDSHRPRYDQRSE